MPEVASYLTVPHIQMPILHSLSRSVTAIDLVTLHLLILTH